LKQSITAVRSFGANEEINNTFTLKRIDVTNGLFGGKGIKKDI